MQELLIFPYNGNGIEAADCIGEKYKLVGFIDDTPEKQGADTFGFKVYSRDALKMFPEAKILAVPGSPSSYLKRDLHIGSLNVPIERFATVIHPTAVIADRVQLGYNILIMAGAVVTSNAKIGNHVNILPNSVIHHDSEIGDYTLIGSNVTVAGFTRIGTKCYIGSGTSIINNIFIGNEVMIGMGSNVIRPVENSKRIAGNPGREI